MLCCWCFLCTNHALLLSLSSGSKRGGMQGAWTDKAPMMACLARYGDVTQFDDVVVPPGHPWAIEPVYCKVRGPVYQASTKPVRITRVTMTCQEDVSNILNRVKHLPPGLGRPEPVDMSSLPTHQVILTGGSQVMPIHMEELDEVAFAITSQRVVYVCFLYCCGVPLCAYEEVAQYLCVYWNAGSQFKHLPSPLEFLKPRVCTKVCAASPGASICRWDPIWLLQRSHGSAMRSSQVGGTLGY